MKKLVLLAGLIALAGCESAPEEVAGKTPIFITDDCALLTAISRSQYGLNASSPQMSVRLQGEDAPWRPGCDWKAAGVNLVEVSGPEGEAATASWDKLTFGRPRYDTLGALVRTSISRAGQLTQELCRVAYTDGAWAVESCGPDPKLTRPRPDAPTPADQTPEGRLPAQPANPDVRPRDVVIPQADPGAPPGGGPG